MPHHRYLESFTGNISSNGLP